MHETSSLNLNVKDNDLNEIRRILLSDFLTFHRTIFKMRTGRDFVMSQPMGNESHFITLSREFTNVFLGLTNRLYIGCPPGWAKSEFCKSFVAFCFAHFDYCKFLYISHSFDLASYHTSYIKQTMMMPMYKRLFGIEIRRDSSAKDFFQTTGGGAVAAFGSQGGITGHDAGLPGIGGFTGALIIDDIHKPDEVHSDNIREKVKSNFFGTIERRLRNPNVPIIMIGQRLHEDDLPAYLMSGADGQNWSKCLIKGIDDAGNAVYPEVNPLEQLRNMERTQPYVFSSQIQQNPLPSGGALYKRDDFVILEEMPDILATFVTSDTAETTEEYNDATVFSFWGIYQMKFKGEVVPDFYGLHWLDCVEFRIEPRELEDYFLDFWSSCMRFPVKPKLAAIEKKSTGVTLISVMKNIPGIRIIDVHRSGAVNSKSNRFITIQKQIGSKQVTFPLGGRHNEMCISHMIKITPSGVHRWDDIADTCYDGVKIALIDKSIIPIEVRKNYEEVGKKILSTSNNIDRLRKKAYGV